MLQLARMRLFPIVIVVLATAACGGDAPSEGESAEARFNMVEATRPTSAEECRLSREVADAYLRDRNTEKYRLWDSFADIACRTADQESGIFR